MCSLILCLDEVQVEVSLLEIVRYIVLFLGGYVCLCIQYKVISVADVVLGFDGMFHKLVELVHVDTLYQYKKDGPARKRDRRS